MKSPEEPNKNKEDSPSPKTKVKVESIQERLGHTTPTFLGAPQKAMCPSYLRSWNCWSAGEDGVWEDQARKPHPDKLSFKLEGKFTHLQ